MNPCIDAILMQVARPQQIAAISHYSQDASATSITLAQAMRFKTTSGTAEEVIALNPDLVIAGAHVALPTVHALQRMGIRLVQTRVADSVQQSRAQIMQVAEAVGAPQRGRQLIARIDAALARATPTNAKPISAVIWQGEGMVPGAGTLADELLRRTGFRNMSRQYGLQQWDLLPLELLLAQPPQVLLTVHGTGQKTDRLLAHPVLQRLNDRVTTAAFPMRLLQCAGPTIIDAVARLAEVRRTFVAAQ